MLELLNSEKFMVIFRGIPNEYIKQTAKAAYDGGVRIFEVTFDPSDPDTVKNTQTAITTIYDYLGSGIEVCAGTCVKPEFVDAAHKAGAKAIISPGTQKSVIDRTKELGMLSMPGAFTPTEIMTAYEMGADIVKVFPILPEDVRLLQVIMSPLSHIPFITTGGVNPETAPKFLALGAKAVAAGATIANRQMAENGEFEKIYQNAKAHIDAIKNM